MASIRFGFRTTRVRTYDLRYFNITKDEAESFAVPYDGFDIWNTDKSMTVDKPRIEKRVKYFHIMFIPFFPSGIQWTIRNKNGLFKVNALCERKIKTVNPKSYPPWYSFLAPIIAITAFLGYFMVNKIDTQVRRANYAKKIEDTRIQLIKELDSVAPPYYMVFDESYNVLNFKRVDSIKNNTFYVTNVVYGFDKYDSNYEYHNVFTTASLEPKVFSRESILKLIPENREDASYQNQNIKLTEVIAVADFEKPLLEFNFHLSGITIQNLGKPLTLVSFENKSTTTTLWAAKTNTFIDTNKRARVSYIPSDNPSEISNLKFVFSDNENLYEYEVQGTFKQAKSYTAFRDTSARLIE